MILSKYSEFKFNFLPTTYITSIAKDLEMTSHFFNTIKEIKPLYCDGIDFIEQVLRYIKYSGYIKNRNESNNINKNNNVARIILGCTKDYKNFKTFHSQGIKGFESMVGSYAMYIPATVNPKTVEELHNIMARGAAAAGARLQEYYAVDYCPGVNYNFKQTNEVYIKWAKYWPEKLSKLKTSE